MKKSVSFLLKSESSLSGIFLSSYAANILLRSDFPSKEVQLAIISNIIVNIHICTDKYCIRQYMVYPAKIQKMIFDIEPDKMIRIYSLKLNFPQFEQFVTFLLRQKFISQFLFLA